MRLIIVLLILCNYSYAADYQKILNASCYIYSKSAGKANGGSGSGCVIGQDATEVFILTAGHVAEKDSVGWVYFTHGGNQKERLIRRESSSSQEYLVQHFPRLTHSIAVRLSDHTTL